MARKIITGDKELEASLRHMADKSADNVAKAALGGSLSVLTRNIKKAAPVGATGNLKASIGSRFEKGSRQNKGKVRAIAGINVGKRTKKEKAAGSMIRGPHAHLVALGTKARKRKTLGGKFAGIKNPTTDQLSTGVMPSNPFVKNASGQGHAQMLLASQKRAAKALDREAVKAARRTRSN
jgi:hypothetical protein